MNEPRTPRNKWTGEFEDKDPSKKQTKEERRKYMREYMRDYYQGLRRRTVAQIKKDHKCNPKPISKNGVRVARCSICGKFFI